MATLKEIAERAAAIGVGAYVLATTGVATGPAVPLAGLAGMAASTGLAARRSSNDRAAQASLAMLEAVPEFAGANLARVEALLMDRTRDVDLGPAALIDAARAADHGQRDGFATTLVAGLMAGIATEPGEERERRLVEAALVASLRCLLADPAMQERLQATLLLQALRDQFAALGMLADIARVQRVEAALAAARHAEMMDHLRQSDEFRRMRAAGITETAIAALYERAGVLAAEPDEQWRQFHAWVESALRLQAEAAAGTNLGAWVDRVIDKAAALARGGDVRAAAESVEAALAAEAEETRARQLRLIDTALQHRLLIPDPEGAGDLILRTADLEAGGRASFDMLLTLQDTWYKRGLDEGLNLDLAIAIVVARRALARAAGPDERGAAGNNLGNALATLGGRDAGTERLEQAVAAYRLALNEQTRDRVPLDWAATQNNLGSALATLGERQAGTARLKEAVAAFRAALEERTRERVPLDWAATQNNLGNALRALGERQAGTARLEEAVAAYRAALEERTPERVPLDWAMTQMNLGNALAILGERQSGTARFEEAVAAYRAALEEYRHDRVPLNWARAQMNLGNALQRLGAREAGTARLEKAVAAYRAALEEWTRDRAPLDWAMTQSNLGVALATLGGREACTERLLEAVKAHRAALEELTRERMPLQWGMTQGNLANLEIAFFDRTGLAGHLEAAQAHLDAARAVFVQAGAGQYLHMAAEQQSQIDRRRPAAG